MKIEALKCPNCAASALSDSAICDFCHSRLKTMACPGCFGLMFIGSLHCSRCGAKTVPASPGPDERSGDCPRCQISLKPLQISDAALLECEKCGGFWSDAETFENICAERESQSSVLFFVREKQYPVRSIPITYVPCPDCKQLMNRNNFARSSGVILDICKQHGVWFDAEELPKIIEFIRQGGIDHARNKEKLQLKEQKRDLADQRRRSSLEDRRFRTGGRIWDESHSISIRGFVRLLFD